MKRDWKPNQATKTQEEKIIQVLKEIKFQSVLELGVGFGRIAGHVLANFVVPRYMGLDLVEKQLDCVIQDYPQVNTIFADIHEFDTDRTWDVILSVEFLMHIIPEKIDEVFAKMGKWSQKAIVSLDYAPIPEKRRALSPHNWEYDYKEFYSKIGTVTEHRISPFQCVYVCKKN